MRKNGKPNSFTNSTKQTGTNLIALKIWSVGEVQGDDQLALLTMHHLPAFQLNVKFLRSILGDVLKLNLKLAEALVLARIIVKHLDVKLFVFDILFYYVNTGMQYERNTFSWTPIQSCSSHTGLRF